jgi:hypothetical protein
MWETLPFDRTAQVELPPGVAISLPKADEESHRSEKITRQRPVLLQLETQRGLPLTASWR